MKYITNDAHVHKKMWECDKNTAQNIPIWGITIQNEPITTQRWESIIYSEEEERYFLKNYLGPVMKKEGIGDKNIVVWDYN